jgi:hypothetical protein
MIKQLNDTDDQQGDGKRAQVMILHQQVQEEQDDQSAQ